MIYFVLARELNAVKIGYSANPMKRIATIQSYYPYKLDIVCITDGDKFSERAYHKEYEHLRLNGEWFKYTEEIRNYIFSLEKVDGNFAYEYVNIGVGYKEFRHKVRLVTLKYDIRPTTKGLTFFDFCDIDSNILALALECDRFHKKRPRNFCANWVWYKTLEPKLVKLMGRHSAVGMLSNSECYSLCYDTCWHLLPDCSHLNTTCVW